MMVLSFVLALVSPHANACDIATKEIEFPRMGKHVAYYCKATKFERELALFETKRDSCIYRALQEARKPILVAEANDIVPYWFTKADAEKAGPLLDVRLTLSRSMADGNDRRTGLRALATGQKILASPPPQTNGSPGTPPPRPAVIGIKYEITEPSKFQRDCPPTGCAESFTNLCESG